MPDDLWNLTHPWLRDLKGYVPGKPIEDVARELGLRPEEIDKLASNENPLGPSPKALEAMAKALPIAHLYPDGGGYYLREALAKRAGLERGNVLLGAGSNELLELVGHAFMSPGDEVVMARHSFMIYKLVTRLFGATAVEVPDPGFAHDLPAMAAAITDRTRVVYVTNPSNPTGTLASQEELDDFMCMVPERVVVVFDEAYYEFLEKPPQTLPYVRAGRNVLVLRTFSKAQGLAAMRLGYGFAPLALAEVIERTRQPFNTSGIAQAGALASLDDEEHVRKTRAVAREGRELLAREFTAMGLEYVPGAANFVLFRVGRGKEVFQALLRRGVIIRDMDAYGLPEWVRVSVGLPEQNQRFLAALRAVLAAA